MSVPAFGSDPLIQAPDNTQSFNRYSYVFNNPMSYTDPTGFAGDDGTACENNPTCSVYYFNGSGPEQAQTAIAEPEEPPKPVEADGKGESSVASGGSVNALTQADTSNRNDAQGSNSAQTQPAQQVESVPEAEAVSNAGTAVDAQQTNTLDNVQTGLDVAGLTPGVGIVADGVNAIISVARGDYADAGLSAAAMIPGAGQAVTAAKLGKALSVAEPVGSALKSDAIHRSASFVRGQAAKNGAHFQIVGGDGVTRTLTQIPGGLNGQAGRFEYIVDGSKLTHQRFVSGGRINGVPNRP